MMVSGPTAPTTMAVTSAQILRHAPPPPLHRPPSQNPNLSPQIPKPRRRNPRKCNVHLEPLRQVLLSLCLAEKLLVSLPKNPFSSLILSLIYSLLNRLIESAISVLNMFVADLSLARSEIAAQVFEEMFRMHFLPVLQCYSDRRAIVTHLKPNDVVSSKRVLLKMSEDRASELKELERKYERVLDENCRVFAGYFKSVLENRDGDRVIKLPVVCFGRDWWGRGSG